MKRKSSILFISAAVLVLCLSASAQQSGQSNGQHQAYDVRREVNLLGTVVKYDAASSFAPLGGHLLVQTTSGQVDVHLGNAKVLQANHFELNPGDHVRIIGEDLGTGDGVVFAARIVQKGLQAVAVRNSKGALISTFNTMSPEQIEALRGAR